MDRGCRAMARRNGLEAFSDGTLLLLNGWYRSSPGQSE